MTDRLTYLASPTRRTDEKGDPWLSFGSFWSGIKMRRIDTVTGKTSSADPKLYSLAARAMPALPEPPKPGLPADWQAIEEPLIVHHGDFHYLFRSICAAGARGAAIARWSDAQPM